MQTVEALQWLRQHNLYEAAQSYVPAIKKVLGPSLAITDEQLLIVGDTGAQDKYCASVLSGAYYLASQELKLNSKMLFQDVKSRGDEAGDHIVSALADLPENNVIVLNMSDKLGSIRELGKSFRKWIVKRKHRFVSAMGLGDLPTQQLQSVVSAMDVSYKSFQTSHEKIRQLFNETEEIHVKTDAGTDLYYNVKGISAIAADGNYSKPGTGGNLPAGEVYSPPNGKNVNGTIVIDGSARVQHGTIKIKDPITLTVADGSITNIEGGEEAKVLSDTLDWAASVAKHPGSVRRICEFGVGLNPKAELIGSTLVDEKVYGSAHVGIGSNYWFGGNIYAIIHLDQVFMNPQLEFDGKKVEF